MQTVIQHLSADLLLFIVFLAINLIIGLSVGRQVSTVREFAIGKKDFSTAAITATIVATWINGGFMFYTIQNVYSKGAQYLIVLAGGTLGLLITGQVLAVRMGEFFKNLSVAEAMGDLYGPSIRLVTAISGILNEAGFLAVQFQVIARMLNVLLGLEGSSATLVAASIVILYSAFGGIRAVTITDIFQFIAFSIFIPILALVIWNNLKNPKEVFYALRDNPIFDFKSLLGWNNQFLSSIGLMLFFAIPALSPSIFQRVVMAKDLSQVKKSFTYASIIRLLIALSVALIAIFLLADNPNLDSNSLINYIINTYAYPGVKGLIAIGITGMAMSTADSCLNASAVLAVNDIIKVLSPSLERTIKLVRISSLIVGLCAIGLALYTNGILNVMLVAGSLYMPIVSVPLLLAIFGFRSSKKSVIIGMVGGLLTVAFWNRLLGYTGINNVIPAMLANLFFLLSSHYILRQPGGWVGIKDKAPLLAARQQRKEFWINLFQRLKNFKIYPYLAANLPRHDTTYSFLATYMLAATYVFFFTVPKKDIAQYKALYDVASHSILIFTAVLLTYPAWHHTLKPKWFITWTWPIAICYTLFVVGSQLVLMSGFNSIQVMIFLLNLTITAFLLSSSLSLILPILGLIIGYGIFCFYYGPISFTQIASSIQFNVIHSLAISVFFLALFNYRKRQDKVSIEKEYLGKAYAVKKKELTQVIQFSQQIAQEIEEAPELFNENALAYIRQLVYHIKDYVQLEVSTIALKNLIHDVKALLKIYSFEKEPSLLVQMETKQKDISVDADKIKQLLLNSIVAIHETNKANKPIRIILEDATLGYTVSYIKDYLKKIKALRITITTADNLPLANDIYTFNPISVDSKTMNETLVENLRIIDAHYGYADVNRLDTQVYVIPIQVRDVRAKVMELLREPAKADPEELTHPLAIEVEKELWQKLSHINIDRKAVEKALGTIKKYHAGVRRKSGEPFFTHPIQVALILLSYCQDQDAVIAALLHDTVEDTQLSLANIRVLFGDQVAFLVEKVTNLDNQVRRMALGDHENVERLSENGDKRVMYVKLADRMHNMRTISGHRSLDRQRHISQETLSFFVPAASSLGLTKIAEELKKLSLDVLSKANPGQ